MAAGVSKELDQTMFVDNMPGAAGAIGAHTAAKAAPDGYTFLFAFASLLSSNIYLYKSLPYDPRRDFTAVAVVCDGGPWSFRSIHNSLSKPSPNSLLTARPIQGDCPMVSTPAAGWLSSRAGF